PSRSRLLMNVTRERLHVFEGRGWKNTVAEVENVAGPSAGALQHIVGGPEHAVERSEQQRRIEIALDAAIEPDALPRFVERRAPVGADDVAARAPQLAQNRPRADAEVNGRDTGRRDARED